MKISIPSDENFWVNLALQRTEFLIQSEDGKKALNSWVQSGDKKLINKICNQPNWRQEFARNVLNESRLEAIEITEYVKQNFSNVSSLCSIGPGNGFVEYFLSKSLDINSILLIDIEETPNLHQHAFNSDGSGYCSLESTKDFLENNFKLSNLNLFPTITLCNPKKQKLPDYNIDLTISLLSAGFHYPIAEYRNFLKAKSCSNQKRMLILDRRKNTNQDLDFARHVYTISQNKKSERIVYLMQ